MTSEFERLTSNQSYAEQTVQEFAGKTGYPAVLVSKLLTSAVLLRLDIILKEHGSEGFDLAEASDESFKSIESLLCLETGKLKEICANIYIEQVVMSNPEQSQSLLRSIMSRTDIDQADSKKLQAMYQELERVRLEGL